LKPHIAIFRKSEFTTAILKTEKQITEIYPGADLVEYEIAPRPLYLPLLREGGSAMLIDCGRREHAAEVIPGGL